MAYVTINDYTSIYVGSAQIPADEFAPLAERASDMIDEVTMNRIDVAALSVNDLKRVKKAVCAQIEHLYYQGIETAISGSTSGSYNIGNTSITRAIGGQNGSSTTPRVSPLALRLLFPTGLLYKGVDLC